MSKADKRLSALKRRYDLRSMYFQNKRVALRYPSVTNAVLAALRDGMSFEFARSMGLL